MLSLRIAILALAISAFGSTGAIAAEAMAEMKNADGEGLSTVTLTETPAGVFVLVDLRGLPPGGHGFHIHERGACTPDFKAAGGHFDPMDKAHGIKNPKGRHAGDMPNIHAAADGRMKAEVLNVNVTLGDGVDGVFDGDGSAIIIHDKPDTHGENPGVGPRIACGVIQK